MSALIRLLLYIVAMFLIMVVYLGQQHSSAKEILRASLGKTLKWVSWTIVLVVVMELCFYFFID